MINSENPDFYSNFKHYLSNRYPSTLPLIDQLSWEYIVAPFTVTLKKEFFDVIREFVQLIYRISRTSSYRQQLDSIESEKKWVVPQHQSVLMAYDFHITPEGPKLIEINTNAAMFLIADVLNQIQDVHSEFKNHSIDWLKKAFLTDFQQWSHRPSAEPQKVVITDEDIIHQNRYIEFLMFQDLFTDWGWNPELIDFDQLKQNPHDLSLSTPKGEKIDLLYNRYCDFYLNQPASQLLQNAFINQSCCITPHPYEYHLLADKKRMVNLSSPHFLDHLDTELHATERTLLQQVIPRTVEIQSYSSPSQLWSERKKLFFKPQNLYGGKSVYRGEGLTHKILSRAYEENFLVQKYIPPPEPQFYDSDRNPKGWKYDVRFYVYQDQIQNITCRIYQGQVTNFTRPFSGFAVLKII